MKRAQRRAGRRQQPRTRTGVPNNLQEYLRAASWQALACTGQPTDRTEPRQAAQNLYQSQRPNLGSRFPERRPASCGQSRTRLPYIRPQCDSKQATSARPRKERADHSGRSKPHEDQDGNEANQDCHRERVEDQSPIPVFSCLVPHGDTRLLGQIRLRAARSPRCLIILAGATLLRSRDSSETPTLAPQRCRPPSGIHLSGAARLRLSRRRGALRKYSSGDAAIRGLPQYRQPGRGFENASCAFARPPIPAYADKLSLG
jgi:hypothetical protein